MGKIINEILWYLYYNGKNPLSSLRDMGFDCKKRPKKIVLTNLQKMIDQGLVEKCWYSTIPIRRNERFNEVHYGLSSKGYRAAEKSPLVAKEIKRKTIEYEMDAYRHELESKY